ncbi:hypothetical protein PLANPX_3023 [Lacipirellula parvula]|uniref:Uncharacterized protein n=1 Tax=Lacipirellula parvula TaxID=2650471 RepID=A0A5K7XEV6_9BACT|nr:hypothetical protein PLANPX_3023 [Lacipirellula parvula]
MFFCCDTLLLSGNQSDRAANFIAALQRCNSPGVHHSKPDSEPPLSSFVWNEVVFRSFKSGYLKAVDLVLFRQLHRAAAKRMYRFLDKRFYHKSRSGRWINYLSPTLRRFRWVQSSR